MRTLLVGYDLNRPGQDYADLIAKLNSFGSHWHCLDSTWLIVTELTAAQMRDVLSGLIDANDALLVVDVSGDARAWVGLNENCAKWLRETFV